MLELEGFPAKTRALDTAKTGGVEIKVTRGLRADVKNRALKQAGTTERFDQWSLAAQRKAALERGDHLTPEELDRDPRQKLISAINRLECNAKVFAAR